MIQQSSRTNPRADLGEVYREYSPEGMSFVADLCLPERPVTKKEATLPVIRRENFDAADLNHANGAAFNRVTMSAEEMTYKCVDHGLEGTLTDEDRETYETDFEAEAELVQVIKAKLLIGRELRAAAALFNTTTWPSGTSALYTDVSAAPWDAAGSDVIGHVAGAKEQVRKSIGVAADSMVIGPVTYKNLKANTAILARFVGISVLTAEVWKQYIAQILDIANLYVAEGVYNAAIEGQDADMSDIWSDDYALVFKKQIGPTAGSPGLGRILSWTGGSGGLTNGLDTVVEYREEQTESDVFRVRDFSVEKIIEPYAGHLLKID